ncbi:TraB/GumN family protein [Sphingomonas mesophila]|uniref:TraB/GumN family protein n=1 Tax=Sphingomonas mesophila TaxID=2303576 RepID=UPI0013C35A8A|nr:TraB/GumN family protein [Sphingomonas mesophila]
MTIKSRLLAAALALGLSQPALAQARPDLDPAMWVVKDADTTIYLFGTVHALDGKGDWFNDEVKTAFDRSSELVMEIITPEDPAAVAPLLQKYAIDTSGKSLTSKLSPKHQAMFAAKLKEMGMPPAALDTFRPFFAAMTLTVLDMQKLGINPELGAEKVLTKAAKERKLTIGEVETMEQQMAMLGALEEKEQVRLLEKTLEESAKGKEILDRMMSSWGKGDADGVAKLLNETNTESPALYKLLISDRNKAWAQWVDARLDKPGTVFMAVGAGHLAGPDSVQRYLKDKGIAAKRVPAS